MAIIPPQARHTHPLSPKILFEDQHLIVLSKPAGLLSQGEKTGDENLVDWLRNYLGRDYVGLVHRLDRNTSGVMVVAKRTKSARRLTDALQEGKLHRTYLAWVVGTLKTEVRWLHFLKKDPVKNLVRVCRKEGKEKEAILTARPIRYTTWQSLSITLAEFRLETGRSHQIRVQTAFEGFPILGDFKYGKSGPATQFQRVALHSHRLEFPHPMTAEVLKFEDPLPTDLLIP